MKVLITGANGGFGKLTVHSLLKNGHQVAASMRAVSSRNSDTAEELKNAGSSVVEIDVTDDSSVEKGVQDAISALGGLDVVVNNAGVGVVGMQEHFTPEDFKKLFDINVFGVQRVNRAAAPYLRSQGSGLIVYISSLLGRITLPFYGPYNASKWALEALAENYRVELSGFGIESVIVEPGGYATSFMENLMTPSDSSRNESYGEFMNAPQAMFEGFGEALQNNSEQDPQKVADAIVKVIEMPVGEKPMRTVVDAMGMGAPLDGYNDQLEQIMNGLYSSFHIDNMLRVQPEKQE